MTHGPPYGILDKTEEGLLVGCEELLAAVRRVQPKVHIFGHIHEGYGTLRREGTLFVNASIMTERYEPLNKPITVWARDGKLLVSDGPQVTEPGGHRA